MPCTTCWACRSCREARRATGSYPGNLPPQLRDLLPAGDAVMMLSGSASIRRRRKAITTSAATTASSSSSASWSWPTPWPRSGKRAARAAVIRTRQVTIKTTLLLFRCRNVIERQQGDQQIVAEEMLLWGWRGTPQQRNFLDHEEAKALLATPAPLPSFRRKRGRVSWRTSSKLLARLEADFDAGGRSSSPNGWSSAHERFSALVDGSRRFQVVYPVLPMDLMGVYILLPEG